MLWTDWLEASETFYSAALEIEISCTSYSFVLDLSAPSTCTEALVMEKAQALEFT